MGTGAPGELPPDRAGHGALAKRWPRSGTLEGLGWENHGEIMEKSWKIMENPGKIMENDG